jgi:hypothetical protein
MAVAQVGTTAFATANATTITSASFTPSASSLVVAIVAMGNGGGVASSLGTLTDTSGGTWTRKSGDNATGSGTAEVWIKDSGTSPVAQTVTYDPGGAGASGLVICVRWYSGAKAVASQTGATAVNGGTSSFTTNITPTNVGSIVCGSLSRATDAQTLTANASTFSIGQFNGSSGDTVGLYTSPITTTVATLTLGYTNTSSGLQRQALAEIIPTAASASATLSAGTGTAGDATPAVGAQAQQPAAAGSAGDATVATAVATNGSPQTVGHRVPAVDAGDATATSTVAAEAHYTPPAPSRATVFYNNWPGRSGRRGWPTSYGQLSTLCGGHSRPTSSRPSGALHDTAGSGQ